MNKNTIILFCILFFIVSFGTLTLKVYVQGLNIETDKMKNENHRLNNEIQVLKAEWSYLNNTDRLNLLTKQHLSLNKVQINQIRHIKNLTEQSTESKLLSNIKQVNTTWKYKSRNVILKVTNKNTMEEH